MFLNPPSLQQQSNDISLHAFSTVWMDAVTGELTKQDHWTRMFTQEKTLQKHHVRVIILEF